MNIDCKISRINKTANPDAKKVIIIGASNSLISHGWFFSLLESSANYEVINLSLGACTTLYINYQLEFNSRLIGTADLILVEPIVNDISYLPNGSISESILLNAIEQMYFTLSAYNVPIITLLLPTEKRTKSYEKNIVYRAHMQGALLIDSYLVDLYPLFSNSKDRFNSLFLNAAHIDLCFSKHLSKEINVLIENIFNKTESVRSDFCTRSKKYEHISASLFLNEKPVEKNSNMFSSTLIPVNEEFKFNIPPGRRLVGIMHWNDRNNCHVSISNAEESFELILKGKYLKLSSPSIDISGPLLFSPSHINDNIYIESIMLENLEPVEHYPISKIGKDDALQVEFNISLESMFYKFLHFYSDRVDFPVYKKSWFIKRDSFIDLINYKYFLISVSKAGFSSFDVESAMKKTDNELNRYWEEYDSITSRDT